MVTAAAYYGDLFGFSPVRDSATIRPLELDPVLYPTWTKRRNARPTYFSRIPRQTDISTAVYGAGLLGQSLFPQGEEIAALLCAKRPNGTPLYDEAVILEGRRSSKTMAVWAELIGDAAKTPGRRVLVTAQDGTRIREILRDEIMELLSANGFEARGLGRLLLANGSERIEFANRSLIRAVPPKPGIFRSKPADRIYIDEAGEFDPGLTAAILAAAMPTTDTRPDSQVIVSGTPGGIDPVTGQPTIGKAGMLWDQLQAALALLTKANGRPPVAANIGVLAYMLRDGEVLVRVDELGEKHVDVELLKRVHPGIGTLTTLPKIVSRAQKMTPVQFESEYGCKFPDTAGASAIDPRAWQDCKAGAVLPPRPAHVGVGFDVEPDGSSAALVAAWRDVDGRAHLEVLACRPGTDWLPVQAKRALIKHRGRAAHDSIGANLDVAQVLQRMATPTAPIQLRMMQAATARFVREIETRNLRHYEQPDLNDAVAGAVWRNVGDTGRLIGRKASSFPVCSIVAGVCALWQFDQTARQPDAAGVTFSGGSK